MHRAPARPPLAIHITSYIHVTRHPGYPTLDVIFLGIQMIDQLLLVPLGELVVVLLFDW